MENYENEIWKSVVGYEGLYEVSNLGRVKRLERKNENGYFLKEKILKISKKSNGYRTVSLCKTSHYLHRVVAQAFIPNPENKPEVNHLDECKDNCCADNLEWCTKKENLNYGTRNKRSAESRGITIRNIETKKTYVSAAEAARQLGIDRARITACCTGRAKSYKKQHWIYEEDYQNMLVEQLLDRAFGGEEIETEVEPEVTVNGIQLDDFLASPMGMVLSTEAAAKEVSLYA